MRMFRNWRIFLRPMAWICDSAGGRIVCLAAVACIAAFVLARPMKTQLFIHPSLVNAGEILLHPDLGDTGDGFDAWYMPLAPVAGALLENHVSPGRKAFLIRAVLCLCLLLIFSLGCLLHSPACGLVASVSAVFLYGRLDGMEFEQIIYSAAMLLVGNFLAVSFGSAAVKKLLIGLAIGISLFVKGVLIFFPLVISGYSAVLSRGVAVKCLSGTREDKARTFFEVFLKSLGLLMIAPVLVILLWSSVNYAAGGKIVFLEDSRRAHSNIISGALGLTLTMEGNEYSLAGISRDDNVMLWAAGEIGRHPLRYATAYFKRVWFLVSMHPVLFLAGMFGLWRLRKNDRCIAVGLLAGYFLSIHCLMTVGERYMIPFWLLLCPLAAASIDCICPTPTALPAKQVPSLCGVGVHRMFSWRMAILWLCFFPVFAAFLYTGYRVFAYPLADRDSGKVQASYLEIIAKNPASSWAWTGLGRYYMEKGDMDKALDAFEKSYRLSPRTGETDYILALFIKGDYKDVKVDGVAFADFLSLNPTGNHHNPLLKSLVRLEEGRYEEARQAFKLARNTQCFFRKATTPYEQKLLKRLRDSDRSLERGGINEILLKLPLERRLELAKKLPQISVDNTWLLERTASELQDR